MFKAPVMEKVVLKRISPAEGHRGIRRNLGTKET